MPRQVQPLRELRASRRRDRTGRRRYVSRLCLPYTRDPDSLSNAYASRHMFSPCVEMETRFMRKLLWNRMTPERQDHPQDGGLDRYPSYEIDPPAPLQIFTRLGVLLVIALGFGLAAELLARLPQ